MRRAAKIDSVQPEIVDGLLARGYKLQSLASVGMGVPDLLVLTPRGNMRLLEVKSPGGTRTDAQKKWAQWWGYEHVPCVYTLAEALDVLEGW